MIMAVSRQCHAVVFALVALSFAFVCSFGDNSRPQPPLFSGEKLYHRFGGQRFGEGYVNLFGDSNIHVSDDGLSSSISLDKSTGSGIISQDLYLHGYFSASIKLPEDYTAGVVAAFYTSNGDMFENNHDELDFEFLGNIRGKEWRVQTNVYGNGSTSSGREERYKLWFDPSEDFHQYSILWTETHIIFFVDDVPIREMVRTKEMGAQYPSKPMSVYATVWDGSDWATSGGRYKVNYKYAPFEVKMSNLILEGCAVDPIQQSPWNHNNNNNCKKQDWTLNSESSATETPKDSVKSISELTDEQRTQMRWFRKRHITYSYCDDDARYPTPLAECPPRVPGKRIATASRFGSTRRHHHSRKGQRSTATSSRASST